MDIYATHLPTLRLLGSALKIKAVLELGAGLYSTPTFLDRTAFPHLERLVSHEPLDEWRDAVGAQVGGDARLLLTAMPINEVIPQRGTGYDLIFIDCGLVEAD